MWRLILSLLVLLATTTLSTNVWAQGRCQRGPSSSTTSFRKAPGSLPLPAYFSRNQNPARNTGLAATPFVSSTAMLIPGTNLPHSNRNFVPVAEHYWTQSMVALPEWLGPQKKKRSRQSISANQPATAVPQPPTTTVGQLRLLDADQLGAALDDYLFSTSAE